MQSIWREIVMSVIMGFILPGILLNWNAERDEQPEHGDVVATEPRIQENKVHLTMKLRRSDGTVEEMDMDTYLVGVVLAEMPSTFAMEAKKAQSVAARTFARKACLTGGKHGDGSVCEESTCCQAWITAEAYLRMGGSEKALAQARAAVDATSGYVLTYNGSLIEATYFSCSGGSTEDAVAVWGTEFPYLVSVDSPGEEYAVHHTDTVQFAKQELEDRLGVQLGNEPEGWFQSASYTQGGGIRSIVVGGKTYSGTEVRSLLGLRSTAFSVEAAGEGIAITTRGFGHRVGMSQYGADAMAASGCGYQEILAHYYPGTTLELTNDPG
jgi:stage II sporulation protein D